MWKRTLCAMLAALVLWAAAPAHAEDPPDLQSTQEQREQIGAELQKLESLQRDVLQQLFQLNLQLAQTRDRLAALQRQVEVVEADLARTREELAGLQARYQKRLESFGRRARFLWERGRVAFLTVLFGSTTFADFLERLRLLELIIQQDAALMRELRQLRAAVTDKAAQLERQQAELQSLHRQVLQQEAQLAAEVQAKEEALASLKEQRARYEESLTDLERVWLEQAVPVLSAFGRAMRKVAVRAGEIEPEQVKTTAFPPGVTVTVNEKAINAFLGRTDDLRALKVRLEQGSTRLEGKFSGISLEIRGTFQLLSATAVRYSAGEVRFYDLSLPPQVVEAFTREGGFDVDVSAVVRPFRLSEVREEPGRLVVKAGM